MKRNYAADKANGNPVLSESEFDWRTKAYVLGGIIGAVVGVGAAYMYVSSAEREKRKPELQASEAVGIGLAVLAMLRQIAGLHGGDDKKKRR